FNDLHLFNIMVAEDESGEPSVALLDFEAAAHVDEGLRQTVANPAFVAPAERRGFSVDRYALACLRLALFLPLTSLLVLDRAKAAHLAAVAAAQFPVPRRFLDEAVEEILSGAPQGAPGGRLPAPPGPYLPVEPGDWPAARTSMTAAIRASATPDREDRFVPGDIAQFANAGGGTCFGNGIAGVLHALAETGAGPWPEAEEWLLQRTEEPDSGTPLGFYDGLAGTAWTLHR
ncbi:serine/threonine protein kinase, partial [Streptomyces sp. NRRL S-444]